jgi:hypothetical protein
MRQRVSIGIAVLLMWFGAQSVQQAVLGQDRPAGSGKAPGPNPRAVNTEAPELNSPTDAKHPPMFPRRGTRKIYEDERVIAWDELLTTGPALWHKHIREQVSIHVEHGFVQHFFTGRAPERAWDDDDHGPVPHVGGLIRPGTFHAERSPDLRQKHTLWIEVKGTEPADCGSWSTAAVCAGTTPMAVPTGPRQVSVDTGGKRYPPLFPRDGAGKVYEDARLIIWDEQLSAGPTVLRMPVRDGFNFHMTHGLVEYAYGDGRKNELLWSDWEEDEFLPTPHIGGVVRAGSAAYGERSADIKKGQRRTFWVEYKGTEPVGCKNWSTDASCK